ncbi:MAG: aspartate--tRNA(Asn) ligase [Candidatus Pacebacteria bacterium]|jgi:nondiscriminating aspartyl-tRNA synthetase|nr:aspartate--tRNA(Asn) ligase [bacterium]MDP6527754.1 aspartate--tRNA(Asn) ligase [Candidatus Paceibacterota bacterium]MDP6659591.1 aspartate--tRNA(Asn) ligase [Candidatus Paceibacterota bacterium]|tara:strand:- start:23781 stop:25106 length:1326 start_codon:yes stop_codon:yes gene_type:complete
MDRTAIGELNEKVGSEVRVAGSVSVRRDHGKLIFFDLRDQSGTVQAVVTPKVDAHKVASEMRPEWAVRVGGVVNKRPDNMVNSEIPLGDIELEVKEIEVLGRAQELPFDTDAELNIDTHLDYLPLTLRTKKSRAIFKVQSEIAYAFRDSLKKCGFTEFQAPKIIGEDAEGGASVFEVEYFDNKANLAQSPQFYKQIMVGVFEKVFSVGSVFRAEKHKTTRHLNEYTSLDIEMGYIEDHTDVMKFTSGLMRVINEHLKETCKEEFELLGAEFPSIPEEIPYMKLREAQELIKAEFGEDGVGAPDLEPQHERMISEYAKNQFDSDFVFVTHFPTSKRPMYTYPDEEDPTYTKGFDLLFRGLEILTGSQRIHDYDQLVESMKKKGLVPEKFSFYLQAFKYGMPPHGGFGMGLERLTARFLGLDNVKEATLFPREINRIDTLLSE